MSFIERHSRRKSFSHDVNEVSQPEPVHFAEEHFAEETTDLRECVKHREYSSQVKADYSFKWQKTGCQQRKQEYQVWRSKEDWKERAMYSFIRHFSKKLC